MIENDFSFADIESVNFAVSLRPNSQRYFVPTDNLIKDALKEVLGRDRSIFLTNRRRLGTA